MKVLGRVAKRIKPCKHICFEKRVDRWIIHSFIKLKGQMILTTTLIEIIPIKPLNPHPVAEATAIERDEATAVEAMVEEMAKSEGEKSNLMTPVRIIAPTPSHT